MKRLVPIAAAAIALGAGGFALAGGVAVTLGPSGPQPKVVTVSWGDTLSFANGDSVTHAITSPRDDLRSPAIPPGGTYTSVVTARTGTYPYKQTGGKSLPGFLVVRTSGTVSLTAQPKSVLYGRSVTLEGVSSIPSTPVLIEQHLRGARDWTQIATVTSAEDGEFSTVASLPIGTNVRASVASGPGALHSPCTSASAPASRSPRRRAGPSRTGGSTWWPDHARRTPRGACTCSPAACARAPGSAPRRSGRAPAAARPSSGRHSRAGPCCAWSQERRPRQGLQPERERHDLGDGEGRAPAPAHHRSAPVRGKPRFPRWPPR